MREILRNWHVGLRGECIYIFISRKNKQYLHRLGLGATVSKSTAATIREAARLKGKLSNKPVRDRGEVLDDKRKKEDEEEDEDSRNTAIVGRKTTITTTTAGSNKRAGIADVFASRKKAKRVEKGTAETKADDFFEEWTGFSEQVSVEGMPDDVVPDGPPSTPSSSYSPPPLPPPPPPLRNRSESERRGSGGSIKVRQAVSLSPVSRPTLSRVDSSTTTTTSPVPLLNLFGPPPVPSSVESSKTDVQSTKKEKRRRRRKKQRSDRE